MTKARKKAPKKKAVPKAGARKPKPKPKAASKRKPKAKPARLAPPARVSVADQADDNKALEILRRIQSGGRPPNQQELAAIRRFELRREKKRLYDGLQSVPQTILCELVGSQKKIIREWEGAGMPRNPGRGASYDLFSIMPWLKDRWLGRVRASDVEDRRRQSSYKADLMELELRRRRGELIEVASVMREGGELVKRARAALLGIPKKYAARLANSEAPEIEGELTAAMNEALAGLAEKYGGDGRV